MSYLLRRLIAFFPLTWRDRHRQRWYEIQKFLRHQWVVIRWHLRRPPEPARADGLRYVHLGCGSVNVPGYINIDVRIAPHIHYQSTVEALPMLSDNSVDLIYCSHCLEHLSHRLVPKALNEWRRVLKPGATLRLAVPDFQLIVAAYHALDNDIEGIQAPLMGGQDYPANFHCAMFDQKYLARLLAAAGFEAIERWVADEEHCRSFADYSCGTVTLKARPFPVTLNLQARKSVSASIV